MINGVRLTGGIAAMVLVLGIAACAEPAASDDPQTPEVTLVTPETWELPDELRDAFERQSGFRLVHTTVGRTPAELVEELAADNGRALGDVIAGIDTATALQAQETGALAVYTSPESNQGPQRFAVDRKQLLSAVDRLIVCVNVDDDWFAEQDVAPPQALTDLADPAYEDLLAAPSPESTEEGAGFLFATVAAQGAQGWQPLWSDLKDNGVQVLPVMAEVRALYTAAAEEGQRPLVVGPATLPGVVAAQNEAQTSLLPGSCHQQVRYAGVLAGADNAEHAGKLLDFLLAQQFQNAVPELYGTYPVRDDTELPDGWSEVAAEPTATTLPAREADAGRKKWITQWRKLMG